MNCREALVPEVNNPGRTYEEWHGQVFPYLPTARAGVATWELSSHRVLMDGLRALRLSPRPRDRAPIARPA